MISGIIRKNNDDYIFKINQYISYVDIEKANNMSKEDVELIKTEEEKIPYRNNKVYSFKVKPNNNCLIKIDNYKHVVGLYCNCMEFLRTNSCEHLSLIFKEYYELLFDEHEEKDIRKISSQILKKYSNNKLIIKKEVFLELEIIPHIREYYINYYNKIKNYCFELKVKIGNDKMYSYNSHQSSFINVYNNQSGSCYFGVSFTYDYDTCFFNKTNERIINFINNNFENINRNVYSSQTIVYLLKELEDTNFSFKFNNHEINYINEGFPFKSVISDNDSENYQIEFNANEFIPIGNNNEYVYVDGNMYHLTKKESNLVSDIIKNEMDKIVIPKNKINEFSKGILPIIKKQVELEENIKDKIIIITNPECELYFDLKENNIDVKIYFVYDKKINYFDKSNIIRYEYFENKVIEDITSYGFNIENKKIELNDINEIVNFMEVGLNELSEKYKIFITEKLKKVNIKRKTNISSTFKIGQDNILNYKFELDGINESELVNIFKDIKAKKKYYRLKSGDILNLEDDNLKELNDLVEEMEITDEDIVNGKGEVLKYRAIYLDSIKNTKYHIVKTDNLFDNFISNFYKYKDSELTITKDLDILRDYQLTGVKWLYNIDKTGFGGILADEMGLGKTIQTIYYIRQILAINEGAKFLIVVPTSLLYNWYHEFDMYAEEIKKILVIGTKLKRKKLLDNDVSVFITTYGLVREDEDYYLEKKYHAIIIDEAQNIKNPISGISKTVKKIKADTRFALTGTPLENSTLELWSIFDFIMPGYLSSIQKFQSKYKIDTFNEETDNLIKGLNKQISPFILRRKKADVIKELPSKIENNIYIDLSEEQKKMYVLELERVKKEIDDAINSGGISKARFLILSLLTKLRQICIDPRIVYEHYNGTSNKIDRFISIVTESISNGHKILVFTSFKSALNIVHNALLEKGIESYVIDGSVTSKKRMERVNNFNDENNNINVFLIMLKAGGTGLNLTKADIVIHLDLWWNPQAENQATDRAHRIGQKNVVEVIKLISKGTIEEKVLELQEKKKKLSDELIDGTVRDQNILSQLDEKEIKNLLSYENKD